MKIAVFGIFDGIHNGHRSLFAQAKEYGDYLIAIVGRDKSCLELKQKKPQNSEEKRRKLVEKEDDVDEAVLGDKELSTYKVLQEINPDVVCLGYDQEELFQDLKKWKERTGADFPIKRMEYYNKKNTMKKNFKTPFLATDGIILEEGKILMMKRAISPCKGYWELPGGHVDYGEKVEEAVKREIKEELGISASIKKLFGVYSNPDRDPRYHIVSVVYFLEKERGEIQLSRESSEFKYFPLQTLPEKIGFDHRKVINDFKEEYFG